MLLIGSFKLEKVYMSFFNYQGLLISVLPEVRFWLVHLFTIIKINGKYLKIKIKIEYGLQQKQFLLLLTCTKSLNIYFS